MNSDTQTDISIAVRDDGFGIVNDLFSVQEISLITEAIVSSRLPRTKAGIRHAMREPAIAELARAPRLISIASEALGDGAFPYRATLFDKSPDANWLVVWHQDTALPLLERREVAGWGPWSVKDGVTYAHAPAAALEKVLAIRVHLDDSTSDNGPLRVLPRTHNRGVLSDDVMHQLSEQIAAEECIVRRGGLVLMRPLLVHASSKSRSDISRRVVHIEYAAQAEFDGLQIARS